MVQSSIPTADFVKVENETDARAALRRFGLPVVIKADGLMAGKGVVVARSSDEAEAAVAGLRGPLVIEACLQGEEVSFIALCDGRECVPLLPTQDHKAAFDGDVGPNTGGMGAYCRRGILTEGEAARVLETVIRPVLARTAFTGFLYAGLMMTAEGPKVLEFNVRMGDPETQPLMMMLDCDWAEVLMAAAEGRLAGAPVSWRDGAAVCVVMASAGYPGAYETGKVITGVEECGATVFQAGTRVGASGLETAGGRVLGVTAWGTDLGSAVADAYAGVERIRFEGMHYRRDIGRLRSRGNQGGR
jgi:phosphoribosylamine--glycine ligase